MIRMKVGVESRLGLSSEGAASGPAAADTHEELRRAKRLRWSQKDEVASMLLEGRADTTAGQRLSRLLQQLGHCPVEVTVTYRDLHVETDAVDSALHVVLNAVSGQLAPGRMTLLLGPPSSGKSMLLKALSGRLPLNSRLRSSGEVLYNGLPISELEVKRMAAMVEQMDFHIGSLSVFDTVDFAAHCLDNEHGRQELLGRVEQLLERCQQEHAAARHAAKAVEAGQGVAATEPPQTSAKLASNGVSSVSWQERGTESSAELLDVDVDLAKLVAVALKHGLVAPVVLEIMGLSHCAATVVGDFMRRGISGGEKKRLSTAEVLVGPQSVMCMDEITTGLDSATAYSVIRTLRDMCHSLHRTFLISLLQPQPEVVSQFDDLLLLTDGDIIYHGPVDTVLQHFELRLGFACPPLKDRISFLQEISTPTGQLEFATSTLLEAHGLNELVREPAQLLRAPPEGLLVPSSKMAAEFWEKSESGRAMAAKVAAAASRDASPGGLPPHGERYFNPFLRLLLLVLKREAKIALTMRGFYLARVVQCAVFGILVGALFATIQPSVSYGRSVLAVCTLSVIFVSFLSSVQITFVFSAKRAFIKHRENRLVHPASIPMAQLLTQLPQSTLEAIVFGSSVYFLAGLTPEPAPFFRYLLVTWSTSNALAGMFRLIGSAVQTPVGANAGAFCILLLLMVTNGFVAIDLPAWIAWLTDINPIAWSIKGLVANEFANVRWQYDVQPGVTAGDAVASAFNFKTNLAWTYGAVGFLWGSLLVYMLAAGVALRFTTFPAPEARVSEMDLHDKTETGSPGSLKKGTARHVKGALRHITSIYHSMRKPKDGGQSQELDLHLITLCCQNLNYYVPDPSKGEAPGVVKDTDDKEVLGKLQLLANVSFHVEPGTLLALMGGSGAGKSTLMDVVLGRKTLGIVRGDIMVNGHPKVQASWSRVCGYVEQDCIHSPGTTVREALVFSARLRLEESQVSMQQVHNLVDATLSVVELDSLKDRVVGKPEEGLTVEQRKRLSIAVELVANPSLLFMDEPTSGLDARAAAIVMRAVKNISLSNRTIMVVIHQPSIDIFLSFDQLLLLHLGGRIAYFGPLGERSSSLISYLQGQPDVQPLQPGHNAASWMLEVTGGSMSTLYTRSHADFCAIYEASALKAANDARSHQLIEECAAKHAPLQLATRYATCLSTQRRMLTWKYVRCWWRDPSSNAIRLGMSTIVAFVYALVYWGKGRLESPVDVGSIQSIMGMSFSMCIFNGMFCAMNIQPVVTTERVVFWRERAASMYSTFPFALALGVAELPYIAAQTVILVCISYWTIQYEAVAWKFVFWLLMVFSTLLFFSFLGQLLVFATPNPLLAQLLVAAFNQIFTMFNGFLQPWSLMPAGWKWLNRISPTTYVLDGLACSQMCDRTDLELVLPDGSSTTVSAFVFSYWNYTQDFVWWTLLIVFAFNCACIMAITVLIRFVSFQRR